MPVRKGGAGESFAIPVFEQGHLAELAAWTQSKVNSSRDAYNYCRWSRRSLEDYDVEAWLTQQDNNSTKKSKRTVYGEVPCSLYRPISMLISAQRVLMCWRQGACLCARILLCTLAGRRAYLLSARLRPALAKLAAKVANQALTCAWEHCYSTRRADAFSLFLFF